MPDLSVLGSSESIVPVLGRFNGLTLPNFFSLFELFDKIAIGGLSSPSFDLDAIIK